MSGLPGGFRDTPLGPVPGREETQSRRGAETPGDLPDGFRETPLGHLPETWEIATLEEATTFTRKPRSLDLSHHKSVPFIPMEMVPDSGTWIKQYELREGSQIRSGTYCEKGDILLAKITPSFENGKQGIVGEIPLHFAYATTEVFPIHPRPDRLDRAFLFHHLRLPSVREEIAGKMEGSTGRQRIPRAVIARQTIPLPPLPEQRAIAHVLRTVQQAREATEDVIAAARELKRSLMRHLFTYGPVPVDQTEQVELQGTEIGPIPAGWKIAQLGDVAKIGNGSTPKRTNPAYWEGGTIPWLTSGKVHEGTIRQADEFVTELAQEEYHLPLVPKGSVVVAITGQGKTLGNAARVTFDTCINQHLAYIQFQASYVLPEFVLVFLQGQYDNLRRASRAGGSTKGALTCGFLKAYPLPVPSTANQSQIAHILATVDAKIAAEEARRDALDDFFRTLLHHLMTAKIRTQGRQNAKTQSA